MTVRGRHLWRVVIIAALLVGCADWPASREAEHGSEATLDPGLEAAPAIVTSSASEDDNVVGSAVPAPCRKE